MFAVPTVSVSIPELSSNVVRGAQQADSFTITPVVRRGAAAANGGSFFDCDSCDARIAGERGLNDLGQLAIFGLIGNCQGLHVISKGSDTLVADVCHATQFGRFSLYAGANINNQGQVVLNMGPAINNTIVDMILLYSGSQLQKIAAEGDQSPTGRLFGYCGFSRPNINNKGDVAFSSCLKDDQGNFAGNGVFVYSAGSVRKVAGENDPSPVGGQFAFVSGSPLPAYINDKDDVLFAAGQIDPDPTVFERWGLFLSMSDGTFKKIELGRDTMPNGSKAADNSVGLGTLNNKGDVVFSVRLTGNPVSGLFLYSGGQTRTIFVDGDPTPIGGTFDRQSAIDDPVSKINDNGTVAFMTDIIGGSSPQAIFLASSRAILKVVGVGDRLPTGEKIRDINSFALNNFGQVAFFANESGSLLNPNPLGVFLATPNPPAITSMKLKHKKSGAVLYVDGNAMITNDTVIEINGVALGELSYPTEFQENGGTTTRVISRDPRLEQILQSGQPVQITVFNSLTNLRSGAVSLAP
jgi:hypothetical protein